MLAPSFASFIIIYYLLRLLLLATTVRCSKRNTLMPFPFRCSYRRCHTGKLILPFYEPLLAVPKHRLVTGILIALHLLMPLESMNATHSPRETSCNLIVVSARNISEVSQIVPYCIKRTVYIGNGHLCSVLKDCVIIEGNL